MSRQRSLAGSLAVGRAVAALALLLPSAAASAQVGVLARSEGPHVDLDALKPFYRSGDFGASTSILYATGYVPVGDATLVAGIGVSRATGERPTSNVLANPRIGILVGDPDERQVEVAVTLPLATALGGGDDDAIGTALVADIERLENFLPDLWSISAQFQQAWPAGPGAHRWGIRAGGIAMLPTKGSGDREVFARYGAFTRIPMEQAILGFELGGIALLTGHGGSLSGRTIHTAAASLGLPGRLQPTLYVRIPVDSELGDALDGVIGLRLRL